jgi:uncharacterized protein
VVSGQWSVVGGRWSETGNRKPETGNRKPNPTLTPSPESRVPSPQPRIWYLCPLMNRLTLQPLLLGLFLLLAGPLAWADGLYVGESVLDESGAISSAAQLRALDEVLIRLSGMVDESPVALLGLGAADVRQLQQSQQRIAVERLGADGATVRELRLRVEFYPAAVNQLLQRHQLPSWGRERPAILFWIALEDDEQGAHLARDPVLEQHVREQARRFGLDVVRPLGDALDMADVGLADIRGGFMDSSEVAAARYGAGVIAMLDLRQDDEVWNARWFWRLDGRDSSRSLTVETVAEAVEFGMKRLLSELAGRYAIFVGGGDRRVRTVIVDGVVDPVQYAEVLKHLEGLSLVESLTLKRARGRMIEFELVTAGEGLEDVIAMSRLLVIDGQGPQGQLQLRIRQ